MIREAAADAAASLHHTDEELERVWIEQVTTPATLDGIRKLMKFYGVDKVIELVKAQEHHVEKLQSKLLPLRDEQPGKVREG